MSRKMEMNSRECSICSGRVIPKGIIIPDFGNAGLEKGKMVK